MAKKHNKYTYRVTWSEEDAEYVGLCAEFPGLSWLARTPEAALKGIRKVVAEAIADMERSGETVPKPMALRHYSGKFVVRVPPEVHRQCRRPRRESASIGWHAQSSVTKTGSHGCYYGT